jgi:UPF0755 protein
VSNKSTGLPRFQTENIISIDGDEALVTKLIKGTIVTALVLASAALAALVYVGAPANPADTARSFTIRDGDSAAATARRLKEQDFIRSAYYFLYILKQDGRAGAITAGRYELSGAMSPGGILRSLFSETPQNADYRLTVPEGFTAKEIAVRCQDQGFCDAWEFLDIARRPSHYGIDTHGLDVLKLEGFLFPETYFFDRKSDCVSVIQRMTDQFFREFTADDARRAHALGFSVVDAVTLASLIEEEAKAASERRIVSSVIHNRLRSDMKLQVDATVQYALPRRKERLLYEDLEVDSPYNTYKHSGLPPGPICNPGRASIQAALYPAKTDYYYYVAREDGTGRHYFSRTPDEHQRMKEAAARNRGANN